jgi:hypothetical protein
MELLINPFGKISYPRCPITFIMVINVKNENNAKG